ncbi:hypothetical protein BH10PLA2_BH10PLA2_36820 [soil metagenome]
MTQMRSRLFPFWIASQRRGLVMKPVEVEGMEGMIAAFTSAADAAKYMVGRGETLWENKLISRSTIADLRDSLRALDLRGFCFDPAPVGEGKKMTLEQVMKG